MTLQALKRMLVYRVMVLGVLLKFPISAKAMNLAASTKLAENPLWQDSCHP